MTDRELMQEAWETLNLVLAPFPVDDQRCLRVARMLEQRLKQLEQEQKPEPALSKKHLRIGDLWRKHDGK